MEVGLVLPTQYSMGRQVGEGSGMEVGLVGGRRVEMRLESLERIG